MITEILRILPDKKPELYISKLRPSYSFKNRELIVDFMIIAFINDLMVRGILFGPGGEVYGVLSLASDRDLKFDERSKLSTYIGKQLGLSSPINTKKLKSIGYKDE